MDIKTIKIDDQIFCIKTYIEREFSRGSHSHEKYANGKKFLIHIKKGTQYRVDAVNVSTLQIRVKNNFNIYFWYYISHFDKVKEMRRQKLIKILKEQE